MAKKPTTKAEAYRKRAANLESAIKKRSGKGTRVQMLKKQKALTDMASNEDWLDGKAGSQLTPKK